MNVMPNRKVNVGLLSGAVVSIIVWAFGQYGHTIPGEIGAALTTIVSFIISWIVPAADQE